MPDALALQVPDRLEQMVAEGLQIADGEPALAAQVLPKGLLAGLLEDQDGAVTDVLGPSMNRTMCESRRFLSCAASCASRVRRSLSATL